MADDSVPGAHARKQRGGRRSTRVVRAAPWVAILLLISFVQVVRAQLFDAALFALVAAVLVADAAGLLPAVRSRAPHPVPVLAGAALAALALPIAPRHSAPAGVVVTVIGIAVAVLAWPDRASAAAGPGRGPRFRRGAIAWGAVAVAMCLVELTSFVLARAGVTRDGEFPAISELLDPMLADPVGRAAFVVGWLAVGAGLLRPWHRGGDRP